MEVPLLGLTEGDLSMWAQLFQEASRGEKGAAGSGRSQGKAEICLSERRDDGICVLRSGGPGRRGDPNH